LTSTAAYGTKGISPAPKPPRIRWVY
jgi:hypothetical protein